MISLLRNLFDRRESAPPAQFPPDVDDRARRVIESVQPFTMTGVERLHALVEAVRYVCRAGIPGDIVECGVWRGGSSMAAALTLLNLNDTGRDLYLYDTFEGMSAPTATDASFDGISAEAQLRQAPKGEGIWCEASEEDVRRNMESTGYPSGRVHLVRGKVEETIPGVLPERISILRLDTDWYESTRHELLHLFPRLSAGGILLIDDYGHWLGARRATDEFLASRPELFLHRVDYTCRLVVNR